MTMEEARVKARYTKRAVARELNVSEQTIYNWEKGKRLPDAKQFAQMCKMYGCSWADIILP